MKSIMNKREYVIPTLRVVPVAVEYQFLGSQLDDYEDNPIFGSASASPWEDEY